MKPRGGRVDGGALMHGGVLMSETGDIFMAAGGGAGLNRNLGRG